MITIQEAFIDAWRSYRIAQGDEPSALPDPLGGKRRRRQPNGRGQGKEPSQPADTGGGFLIDNDNEEHSDKEEDGAEALQSSRFLPLSFVPDALVNLHLNATDTFVLGLFNEVAISAKDAEEAQGAIYGSRRRKRGVPGVQERTERMISTADFARVADVLLDGKAGVETDDERELADETRGAAQPRPTKRRQRESVPSAEPEYRNTRPRRAAAKYGQNAHNDSLDDYGDELSGPEADEYTNEDTEEAEEPSSQDDGDDSGRKQTPKTRRIKKITVVRKAKGDDVPRKSASGGLRRLARRTTTSDEEDANERDERSDDDEDCMTSQQRRQAHTAFALLTRRLNRITNGHDQSHAGRISKNDVRLLVQSVGEKIAEREIDEMIEEGVHFFARASAPDVTREAAKRAREAAAGHATAQGRHDDALTLGINEFAGILLKGRLI